MYLCFLKNIFIYYNERISNKRKKITDKIVESFKGEC